MDCHQPYLCRKRRLGRQVCYYLRTCVVTQVNITEKRWKTRNEPDSNMSSQHSGLKPPYQGEDFVHNAAVDC